MNYGRKNVCPFKGNAEYFGVWLRSSFVIWTIKRVFAWQWKFMVALLCPNNSHIMSRTDSPCRKQQACYQSYIFAYCVTSPPPFFLPGNNTENIWRKLRSFWPFFFNLSYKPNVLNRDCIKHGLKITVTLVGYPWTYRLFLFICSYTVHKGVVRRIDQCKAYKVKPK